MENRPPLPPFTQQTAEQKVQLAENSWNSKDPVKVASAHIPLIANGVTVQKYFWSEKIIEFLTRKWKKQLDYKLKKERWCYIDNRIAVTFRYEWHDDSEQWHRSYGNELWGFAENGLMQRRIASINDKPSKVSDREFT